MLYRDWLIEDKKDNEYYSFRAYKERNPYNEHIRIIENKFNLYLTVEVTTQPDHKYDRCYVCGILYKDLQIDGCGSPTQLDLELIKRNWIREFIRSYESGSSNDWWSTLVYINNHSIKKWWGEDTIPLDRPDEVRDQIKKIRTFEDRGRQHVKDWPTILTLKWNRIKIGDKIMTKKQIKKLLMENYHQEVRAINKQQLILSHYYKDKLVKELYCIGVTLKNSNDIEWQIDYLMNEPWNSWDKSLYEELLKAIKEDNDKTKATANWNA